MRKPRDIGAELKALSDKAKGLKARRTKQLGELVVVTGADGLDLETLVGALLAAAESAKDDETQEAWRRKGAAFFQQQGRRSKTARTAHSDGAGAATGGDGHGAR